MNCNNHYIAQAYTQFTPAQSKLFNRSFNIQIFMLAVFVDSDETAQYYNFIIIVVFCNRVSSNLKMISSNVHTCRTTPKHE